MDLPSYEVLLAQARAVAMEIAPAEPVTLPPNLRWRNAAVIGGSASLIALYGSQKWWNEGLRGGFKREDEGWFGRHTKNGGIDKIGHAYSTYLGARVLTPVLEWMGNEPASAARIAAWSSWGVLTGVEFIDGFSKQYKFSHEDFIANTAGALLAHAFDRNPDLDEAFDIRLAYRHSPHSSDWDPWGDYSGQRYLLVAKLDAVAALRNNPLTRYLEVSVGYGTRGYDADPPGSARKSRDAYFGVSLNLARLLADGFYNSRRSTTRTQRIAERTFDLVQFPAAAYHRRELDR